jgi:iron(II)-dependent oxidoreductase
VRGVVVIVAVCLPLACAASGMVAIAGGVYRIGTDDGPADTRPAHEVQLAPFAIDRHEVSNAQFAAFLNSLDVEVLRDAAAGEVGAGDLRGPDAARLLTGSAARPLAELDDSDARIALAGGKFVAADGYERHPATESTWYGASAFCRWRGARLPTEAEWEAAARGGRDVRYPWGDAPPDSTRALFAKRRGATTPVGTRPAGATPQGVHDLAGSLAEWTSSLYRAYPYRADDGREDPEARGERVTRGGDYVFDSAPERLTVHFRGGFSRAPEHGHRHIGFRCVR